MICVLSAIWKSAATASSAVPVATTAGSAGSAGSRKSRISGAGMAISITAVASATASAQPSTSCAPRFSPAPSPRPSAWPARTVATCDSPTWIMKMPVRISIAMPCAASSTVPIQPIITAAAEKSPISASVVSPIGQPSRNTCTSAAVSARHSRAKSRCPRVTGASAT